MKVLFPPVHCVELVFIECHFIYLCTFCCCISGCIVCKVYAVLTAPEVWEVCQYPAALLSDRPAPFQHSHSNNSGWCHVGSAGAALCGVCTRLAGLHHSLQGGSEQWWRFPTGGPTSLHTSHGACAHTLIHTHIHTHTHTKTQTHKSSSFRQGCTHANTHIHAHKLTVRC